MLSTLQHAATHEGIRAVRAAWRDIVACDVVDQARPWLLRFDQRRREAAQRLCRAVARLGHQSTLVDQNVDHCGTGLVNTNNMENMQQQQHMHKKQHGELYTQHRPLYTQLHEAWQHALWLGLTNVHHAVQAACLLTLHTINPIPVDHQHSTHALFVGTTSRRRRTGVRRTGVRWTGVAQQLACHHTMSQHHHIMSCDTMSQNIKSQHIMSMWRAAAADARTLQTSDVNTNNTTSPTPSPPSSSLPSPPPSSTLSRLLRHAAATQPLPQLTRVWLQHQGLTSVEGLSVLAPMLGYVDLGNNALVTLQGCFWFVWGGVVGGWVGE